MTIKELYQDIGGDYQDALSRFTCEDFIRRFLDKFQSEPSFAVMLQAIADGDRSAAFSAAHALKGVAGNMAFTRLYNLTCDITEQLRPLTQDASPALVEKLKEEYDRTVEAIRHLD